MQQSSCSPFMLVIVKFVKGPLVSSFNGILPMASQATELPLPFIIISLEYRLPCVFFFQPNLEKKNHFLPSHKTGNHENIYLIKQSNLFAPCVMVY